MFVFKNAGSGYVDAMKKFLRIDEVDASNQVGAAGQVQALEAQVNQKSARADDLSLSLEERLTLAGDYLGLEVVHVLQSLGLRQSDFYQDEDAQSDLRILALAKQLQVPVQWMLQGLVNDLPANSHLGIRVGVEAQKWCEALYGLTLSWVAQCADEIKDDALASALDDAVFSNSMMSNAARRAGGRWQLLDDGLKFVSWHSHYMSESDDIDALEAELERGSDMSYKELSLKLERIIAAEKISKRQIH